MKPPKALGAPGKALFGAVVATLPDEFELTEADAAILTLAAHQADDLARLEKAIAKDGAMVVGSAGQMVVNGAITEARQARLAISRLLGQITIPDEDDEPRTGAGKHARKAARVRWADHERRHRAKT